MRYLLAAILFALPLSVRAAAPDPPPLAIADPPPLVLRVQSLESRAAELEARIRVLEAREAALASGVAKPAAPFPVSLSGMPPDSSSTVDTIAPTADTTPILKPTSNAVPVPCGARTSMDTARTFGITSGCANGSCGTASSYSTGRGAWYPGKLLGR